jgi:hypothetical protein
MKAGEEHVFNIDTLTSGFKEGLMRLFDKGKR